MELIAIARLPYQVQGRAMFEFGGNMMSAELLPRLARLGHNVRVIAEAPPSESGEKRIPFAPGVSGLTVVPFALRYRPSRTPPERAWLDAQRARLTTLLGHLVHERKPDLVVLGRELLAWYAVDVCHELEVPVLVTVQGSPTAGLEHGIYPPPAVEALVRQLAAADGLVTVAGHLRETLTRLGAPGAQTVRNVVDPRRFTPREKDVALMRELSIDPSRHVIASFASRRPEKRLGDIIDAAPRVLAERPEALFLIAGGGQLGDALPEAVEQRGLTESFRFPGEVENAEMPRWLSMADLVVMPSEREGWPLTILEAQACGRPVVASDIPATRELRALGRPVSSFPVGDAGALAGRILDLLADRERRRELGLTGREAALKDDPDEWARAHSRVIEQVAARAERPA
jgi:glycosyltransferase involved in cell wall biosynthesis